MQKDVTDWQKKQRNVDVNCAVLFLFNRAILGIATFEICWRENWCEQASPVCGNQQIWSNRWTTACFFVFPLVHSNNPH